MQKSFNLHNSCGGLAISCKNLSMEVVNNNSEIHTSSGDVSDLDSGPLLFALTDRLSHTDHTDRHRLFLSFFPFPQPFRAISQQAHILCFFESCGSPHDIQLACMMHRMLDVWAQGAVAHVFFA